MKVAVTGGRRYLDVESVKAALDAVHAQHRISCLVHGGAPGADTLAGDWAQQAGIPVVCYMAEWNEYGRSAGYRRNITMLYESKPDLLVVFPGGKGTAHCVSIARRIGIRIYTVGGAL